MAKYTITIDQEFNASLREIFGILSDHESFGRIIGMKVKRIVDASSGQNPNGPGSVRKIKTFGAPAFEETIVAFKENELIEYKITKGSPLKNHFGRQVFSERDGKTHLHYTIEYEPGFSFPGWNTILNMSVKGPITKGIKKLARSYQ